MANPAHLEILKQGVEVWNRWRQENSDVKPDLSKANLEGAHLKGANFERANLREVNLVGAYLERAQLGEAYLKGANLRKAQLVRVNLKGATLRGADLREADLQGAYLQGADLRGANLQKANLQGAYLMGANLLKADLRVADLREAHLLETDLREADLREADLRGAYLKETNLRGASLIYANLRQADLIGADLTNVEFKGAEMGGCSFGKVDLGKAKDLNEINHGFGSTIGIDTIYISKGIIPEVFLRGCGVPEIFITYLPSLVERGIEFYSCFISYSHADKTFAQRLHNDLQAKGIRCWLDEHQLLPGDDILDQIDRGIRLWDKIILICSKESLTSWWVDKEIDIAFEKEETLWKKQEKKVLALIPVDLDRYVFDGWEGGKAKIVKKRYIADCTDWDKDHAKYEKQVRRIVEALKTEDAGRAPGPGAG